MGARVLHRVVLAGFAALALSVSAAGASGVQAAPAAGALSSFTHVLGALSQPGGSKLTSGEATGQFGFGVAMSADGTTALIGGENAAWTFTRSGETWTQQGTKLTGTGGFGRSVVLSADGNTALIAARWDHATWVFTRSNGTWTQPGVKLSGGGGSYVSDQSVALSADGSTALVGAPEDDAFRGAVYVFTRSGTGWTQQGPKLTVTDPLVTAVMLGHAVALSADGNTALISGTDSAAWVFTRSGGSWTVGPKMASGFLTAFGSSLTLSGDGNTALIGASGEDSGAGAAWVYTRSGTTWTQQGIKLTAAGAIGGGFGDRVALSADGSTALIGSRKDNGGIGAAWTFSRSGGIWTQRGRKLTGSGESGAGNFGASLALSADGARALIGGPGDTSSAGAAWVMDPSPPAWTQQGPKLSGSGGFGFEVALSSDGNTALIGSPGYNGGTGAGWVFTRSGNTWTQQGTRLTGGGTNGVGLFGYAVALSADGNTALIGGPGDNDFVGAAWVFTRSGSTWAQQGPKLTGSGESGQGDFGISVALSSDGNTALVGGDSDNDYVGATWVFTRSGSAWSQQGPKLTGGGESGQGSFGFGVALASDGNTALIGGYSDDGFFGAAWVFTRSGSTWSQQGAKLTGAGEAGQGSFGVGVALSGDGNTALIGAPDDKVGVGAAWMFVRTGATWTQQGAKLTGSGETGAGSFGYDVTLSGDGNTALIGGPGDNNDVGAAWAFIRLGATWVLQDTKLTGSGESGAAGFGATVAVSADGKTVLVGGPDDNGGAGAAWAFKVPSTVPGAPTNVRAFADDASATLTWLAPALDGGEPITGYLVTPFIGAVAQAPIPVGPTTGTTVTGLTNDTIYTFTVTAVNGVGAGPASTPSNTVTPNVQGRPLPEPPAVLPRADVPALANISGVRPPRPHH